MFDINIKLDNIMLKLENNFQMVNQSFIGVDKVINENLTSLKTFTGHLAIHGTQIGTVTKSIQNTSNNSEKIMKKFSLSLKKVTYSVNKMNRLPKVLQKFEKSIKKVTQSLNEIAKNSRKNKDTKKKKSIFKIYENSKINIQKATFTLNSKIKLELKNANIAIKSLKFGIFHNAKLVFNKIDAVVSKSIYATKSAFIISMANINALGRIKFMIGVAYFSQCANVGNSSIDKDKRSRRFRSARICANNRAIYKPAKGNKHTLKKRVINLLQSTGKNLQRFKIIVSQKISTKIQGIKNVLQSSLKGVGRFMASILKSKGVSIVLNGIAIALRFMLAPIGLIITGIGLLVGGFMYAYQHFDSFKEKVDMVWNYVSTLFSGNIFESIQKYGANAFAWLEKKYEWFKSILSNVKELIPSFSSWFGTKDEKKTAITLKKKESSNSLENESSFLNSIKRTGGSHSVLKNTMKASNNTRAETSSYNITINAQNSNPLEIEKAVMRALKSVRTKERNLTFKDGDLDAS